MGNLPTLLVVHVPYYIQVLYNITYRMNWSTKVCGKARRQWGEDVGAPALPSLKAHAIIHSGGIKGIVCESSEIVGTSGKAERPPPPSGSAGGPGDHHRLVLRLAVACVAAGTGDGSGGGEAKGPLSGGFRSRTHLPSLPCPSALSRVLPNGLQMQSAVRGGGSLSLSGAEAPLPGRRRTA